MSEYRIINGELHHHGIKGQKWGVRRFQTKDGSLTPAGRKRYGEGGYVTIREAGKNAKKAAKASVAADKARGGVTIRQASKNASAARKASIAADKAHNKALRNETDSAIKQNLDHKKAAKKAANKEYSKSFDKAYNRAIGAYSPIKKHRENAEKRWEDAANKAEAANLADREYKQAKKEYKQAKKDAYNEINKQTGLGEKLTYNDATRRKAAKYVVDNGMSIEDARKRANNDAKRNTAIFVAAYGAITLASIYKK